MFIDTTYEEEKHTATQCEVIGVPSELFYSNDVREKYSSVEFDAELEIEEGDQVFIHYLSTMTAIEDKRCIEDEDGDVYYFIKYDKLFASTRGDQVIMLNGYIAVEPITDEDYKDSEFLAMPDSVKNKDSKEIGRVVFVGAKLKGYQFSPDYSDEHYNVKPGDVVAFTKSSDIPMQYDIHRSFQGDKKMFRMQRKDIMYIC